jgi:hypothetical protein
MKKSSIMALIFACMALRAFAETPSPATPNVLPQASAQAATASTKPAAAKPNAKKAKKSKAAVKAARAVIHAEGTIQRIAAKKSGGTSIVLSRGKRSLVLSLGKATEVKNAEGKIATLADLKKGEKIRVEYSVVGKQDRARAIRILS